MKVPLGSFHLNGHTLGFYPHIQHLKPHLLKAGWNLEGLTLESHEIVITSFYPSVNFRL